MLGVFSRGIPNLTLSLNAQESMGFGFRLTHRRAQAGMVGVWGGCGVP